MGTSGWITEFKRYTYARDDIIREPRIFFFQYTDYVRQEELNEFLYGEMWRTDQIEIDFEQGTKLWEPINDIKKIGKKKELKTPLDAKDTHPNLLASTFQSY